jgi:histidine triad (HIT) family protein
MIYDNNNIFAKIIKGEIPANKIYEDEHILAFKDINPLAPIHVLIIPKFSAISYSDFVKNAPDELLINFFRKIEHIIDLLKVRDSGYRLITNDGDDANQEVKHFHLHLLAGVNLGKII